MLDRYRDFADLAAHESEDEHYRIHVADRASAVAIVAPHGGAIESGTSEIAAAIAGDSLSLYCFEGLIPDRSHEELHITSSRFDEPKALMLVEACQTVITVHGRRDRDDHQTIWLGGLDARLCARIEVKLARFGFRAKSTGHPLKGIGPSNICNRGKRKEGAQLELPQTLRDRCLANSFLLQELVTAMHCAIKPYAKDSCLSGAIGFE